jgi:hypothetical protein
MNTHFFVYRGECYIAYYTYWAPASDQPRLTLITNMNGQKIIATTEMLNVVRTELIIELAY